MIIYDENFNELCHLYVHEDVVWHAELYGSAQVHVPNKFEKGPVLFTDDNAKYEESYEYFIHIFPRPISFKPRLRVFFTDEEGIKILKKMGHIKQD